MRRILAKITRAPRSATFRLLRSVRSLRCRWGAFWAGTRLIMDNSNRLGVPLRINGKGRVSIGRKNSFGFGMAPILGNGAILIQARAPEATIAIGERNITSNNIAIVAIDSITIGNGCQIGDLVAIYDTDFHEIDPVTRNRSSGEHAPVRIGDNVWLGRRVVVLKGVTIGDNSVVATMRVVTKSLLVSCVAGGIWSRLVRQIG